MMGHCEFTAIMARYTEGYDGLKDKDTRTGRPPRLNDENMMTLKEILKKQGISDDQRDRHRDKSAF
jgi:hypothetical protein